MAEHAKAAGGSLWNSGMKMLFNGGLHLSVRDGWWDEAWNPSVGWAIGDGLEDDAATRDIREAEQLYEVLEQEVIPEFYDRDNDGVPHRWLERVYASMSGLTPQFSSHRMVKDYVRLAYCPAAGAINRRIKDDARIAHELYEWHLQLEENWRDLRFGELRVSDSDDHWKFTVDVYLGDLAPDCVRVELYADSLGEGSPTVIPMCRNHALPGAINGYVFEADAPNTRSADDYTPRIVPWHPDAFVPAEQSLIHWQR